MQVEIADQIKQSWHKGPAENASLVYALHSLINEGIPS